jgi:hypothetical protein
MKIARIGWGCGVKNFKEFKEVFDRVDERVGLQGIVPLKELHRELCERDPTIDRNEFICFFVRLAKRKIIELIQVFPCDRAKFRPGETYYSMVFNKHYYSCMLGPKGQILEQRLKKKSR